MMLTWLIFILCVFYLFMIFMNFIIAVIGESYSKVIHSKEAFDYMQRASMIYEREVHFSPGHFSDELLFPKVIIVKKPKEAKATTHKNSWMSFTEQLKTIIKSQSVSISEFLTSKTSEQK